MKKSVAQDLKRLPDILRPKGSEISTTCTEHVMFKSSPRRRKKNRLYAVLCPRSILVRYTTLVMDTEKRHSYGVIPLIGAVDSFEVLLIEQRDIRVPQYWTFAKGTPEANETPLETAMREVGEEVGIFCDEIDTQFQYTEAYSFTRQGVVIEKSVTYFAGRALSRDFVLQEAEVVSARWCTPEEAMRLLKFQGAKEVLAALLLSDAPSRLLSQKSV